MLNKDCESRIISKEIKELFSDIDNFLMKKNEIIENFKKACLQCSTNN